MNRTCIVLMKQFVFVCPGGREHRGRAASGNGVQATSRAPEGARRK